MCFGHVLLKMYQYVIPNEKVSHGLNYASIKFFPIWYSKVHYVILKSSKKKQPWGKAYIDFVLSARKLSMPMTIDYLISNSCFKKKGKFIWINWPFVSCCLNVSNLLFVHFTYKMVYMGSLIRWFFCFCWHMSALVEFFCFRCIDILDNHCLMLLSTICDIVKSCGFFLNIGHFWKCGQNVVTYCDWLCVESKLRTF